MCSSFEQDAKAVDCERHVLSAAVQAGILDIWLKLFKAVLATALLREDGFPTRGWFSYEGDIFHFEKNKKQGSRTHKLRVQYIVKSFLLHII